MSNLTPHPTYRYDPFCRAETTHGRYTWVCYQHKGHNGPHKAGNSANDPIYRTWFDVIDGGAP